MRAAAGLLIAVLTAGCAGSASRVPIFATVPSGRLEWMGEMPVLRLRGTPYEMGYQHGMLLRKEVRASVKNILVSADRQARVPGLRRLASRRKLDRAWARMKPHVPGRYLEELQGLADGSGVPLRSLQQVHALPDITSGMQRYEVLIVQEPNGRKPFVSVGWLGFIGVLSGVNRSGISAARIGAETIDAGMRGVSMPFLLRRVLEESDGLGQAEKIIETELPTASDACRIADAKENPQLWMHQKINLKELF